MAVRSLALAVLSLSLALGAALPAQAQEKAARGPANLGVAVEPSPEAPGQVAYVVRMVTPGGPAAAAGLQRGDVITGLDGRPFAEGDTLPGVVTRHKPGDKVSLRVLRGGQERILTATLGEQPAGEEPGAAPERPSGPRIGAAVIPADGLTAAMRERLGVTAERGLAVVEVLPNSPAARAGLRRGDVLTRVGGKDVADVEALENALRGTDGKALPLHVVRGGEGKDLSLTPAGGPAAGGSGERPREQDRARPYLGLFAVGMDDLSARLRKRLGLTDEKGVVVTEVEPDSPADRAGVKHGDVIAGINGKAVTEPEDLRAAIDEAGPGKTIHLSVLRDKEKKDLTVKVGEAPFPVITRIPSGPGEFEEFPGRGGEDPMERVLERLDQIDRRLRQVEKQLNGKDRVAPPPNREDR